MEEYNNFPNTNDTPNYSYQKPQKPKKSKKKLEYKPKLLKLTCIPIDEIDELFAEQYLATGQLTYKFNNDYFSLAYCASGRILL